MEASALRHSGRLALLSKRSTLLRLQADERLIELTRGGHDRAFEALVDRYQSRLHAFCRGMLRSNEDAEDILQEVFVAAHNAMLADSRPINARPWLYRIARNRCLNHLRKPVAEGQDSMDVLPGENGTSVAERVQKREDFRALISDVGDLAETQRTALLLREIDDLSYEEIAQAMDTTVPAVKSLLVRARMSLADATHGRKLTCGDVRLTLAEAAEGLCKASGAERSHIKHCQPCREYRDQLRSNNRALAALAPLGALAAVKHFFAAKLGIGGAKLGAGAGASGAASSTAATAGGAAGAGAGTVGAGAAAAGGSGGAFSVAGGAAGIIGTKAVAGMASVALLTAGAVEAKHYYGDQGGQAPVAEKAHAKAAVQSPAPPAETVKPTQAHRFTGGVPAEPAQAARPTDDKAASEPKDKTGLAPTEVNDSNHPSTVVSDDSGADAEDAAADEEDPVLSSETIAPPATVGGVGAAGAGGVAQTGPSGATGPSGSTGASGGQTGPPAASGGPTDPAAPPAGTPSPAPGEPTPSPGGTASAPPVQGSAPPSADPRSHPSPPKPAPDPAPNPEP